MAKKKNQSAQYVSKYSFNENSRYTDYLRANEHYFSNNPPTVVQEYKKKPKKPKRLAKWIRNVLVIASIVIFVVAVSTLSYTLVLGGGAYKAKGVTNVHQFVGLEVAPTLKNPKKIDLSSYKSDKEKAQYLYEQSMYTIKDTPYYTAYNSGLLYLKMGSSENYLDIDSVTMKTQKEYFYIVYHMKNSIPILDSAIGGILAKTTDIVTTERMYTSANASNVSYQKVKNNEYDSNGVPTANWDATLGVNGPAVQKKPMITFQSGQDGFYKITNHVITAETILDAEVTYDEELGYYTVSATLNHTDPKTVKYSLDDIRTGTGDSKASYNLIKLNFTVWDTGYLRSFSMVEKWSAKVVISLDFNLETNWQCSYAEEDCNLDKYPDAKTMKKDLGV